jgi:hypothetical protein
MADQDTYSGGPAEIHLISRDLLVIDHASSICRGGSEVLQDAAKSNHPYFKKGYDRGNLLASDLMPHLDRKSLSAVSSFFFFLNSHLGVEETWSPGLRLLQATPRRQATRHESSMLPTQLNVHTS